MGCFILTTIFIPALGPTQPPIQWVPMAPSSNVKPAGLEANHSPPPVDEVNNVWNNNTSTPPICLDGVVLN